MEHFIIGVLVFGSVLGLTLIIERGLALRWRRIIPPNLEETVESCRRQADLPVVRERCRHYPSPLARLLLTADEHRHWPKSENINALQTRARHEIVQLERGLVILEIIVGTAPLLGLVGTIFGLITIFGGMGATGLGGDSMAIANGIAIALRATLMGLLTAIPSLIAWSYYNKKIEVLSVEMETLCDEFLKSLYRGDKTAPEEAPVFSRP